MHQTKDAGAAGPTPEEPGRETAQPPEEGALGEARPFSLTDDPRLRLFALFINLLVVIELFVAMFFATRDPDNLTPVFFKLFFGMLAPTLIVAFVGRRVIGKRLAAKDA
jgi:uncharacterized integral membrane protein